MDIISDIDINSVNLIGPSTILGRTIAVRILISTSLVHLRRQIIEFFRTHTLPILSFFHPKNTQGILLVVTLIAFGLRRFTSVRSRAESAYRRKFWRNIMRGAVTYDEWAHAARMLDKEIPRMSDGEFYDVELVRNKLQELRDRRRVGSLRDVVFYMRADLLRNLGNMCNPELHKDRLQVPRLIKEYIDEVIMHLKMVCDSDSDDLLLEEKLTFMHETRHAFGRTALLLSGGASLGAFHAGVVKTLVDNKLLPRIIAGSSVGSIMCAIVATKTWTELESFFENSVHSLQFFGQLGGVFQVVKRIMTHGAVHDIRQLQKILRTLTSNLTFQEAYDMTGRILGITVCSPRKHEPPRCLNYLTSPHVVIWSAVTASCAFPGLFEAQELMAKDRFGEIVPFHAPFLLGPEGSPAASSRRWRDGSLESDLPMMQLKELFNVNHFIVSQANPHISPLLRLKEIVRAYGGNFAAKIAHLTEMEVKHRFNQILELGYPLAGIAKLFAQDWEGDITVVMPATLAQYSKIIQNPSPLELQKAANQGRRCTWEKLSAIKANCAIELALDECVALLNHKRRLKRSAERAAASQGHKNLFRFNASMRIPSWNCIERESSTGSLDDDLVDVNSFLQQRQQQQPNGTASVEEQLNRNHHVQRAMDDGNVSESESIELNSWTRSGGPLMRTPSASKFINYVQNLELDLEFNRPTPREEEATTPDSNSQVRQMVDRDPYYNNPRLAASDGSSENADSDSSSRQSLTASTSITVTEGDMLQPKKIGNAIVFNVVKKEEFINRSSDSEQHHDADIENIHVESCDVSLDSDSYESNNDAEVELNDGDMPALEPEVMPLHQPLEGESSGHSTIEG